VEYSPLLSREAGVEVYLKLENLQRTGSFKLRGAWNKVMLLAERGCRNLITASTGNHGLAVADAACEADCAVTVFAPRGADPEKLAAIRSRGATVRVEGEDCVAAESAARRAAAMESSVYVSPYNDLDIIAGQGTLACELVRQLPDLRTVYLAVGGGGLCSGVGAVLLDHAHAHGRAGAMAVVGCSPAASAVMLRSLEAGTILELESLPTLSDGTAGGVEADSVTFDLCRAVISRGIQVSEEEIGRGLRDVLSHHHTLVEGAAAVAVAGLREDVRRHGAPAGPAVVILCGANISLSVLRELL
jgi:threonine dehydratase